MSASRTLNGCWVSCAFDDTDAWKCLALGRSLERGLTRHKFVVIVSPFVTQEIRARLSLQGYIYDVPYSLCSNKEKFTLFAMECVYKLEKFEGCIFLHPNTIVLSNADELFTTVGEGGIILSGMTVAVMIPPGVHERVTSYDQLQEDSSWQCLLQKLDFPLCLLEINLDSPHPVPFSANTEKLAFFVTSHPVDKFFAEEKQENWEIGPKPDAKSILVAGVKSSLPELFGVGQDGISEAADYYGADLKALVNSTAIVGMSCRYAGANSIEEFWNLLEKGMEGIRRAPEYRWNKHNSLAQMEHTDRTEVGFLSCPIDNFDSKFFNTNAAELNYLDPQQRMAVRVVWDALEDAGIDPLSLKGSMTGVFGGWWRSEYKEMLEMAGNLEEADFIRGYFGTGLGPMTARISHFYELIGPSISVELGCSTSGVGVHAACTNLLDEQCDLAIAVGSNLLLHPYRIDANMVDGVISTEGRCKTWDSSANGFGRAEGVGVLILKRFPDAYRDGDKIHGIIRGSSVVQEGISHSMGRPTVEVEAKAMAVALGRAKVNPDDVQFLETHGTGTPIGDPIEIDAIARAYNPHQRREKPLIIGSVKTNIGHTESVCGIAGIQKTILSMKNELIPRHLNLKELNPEVKLESIPAKIPLEAIPWKREPGKVRLAGVNSFGITGAQGHFVIQEQPVEGLSKWPFLTKYLQDSRELKFLTFSAKSDDALQTQIGNLKELLLSGDIENLGDLEYSIHTTRAHFPQHRAFLITNGKDDLLHQLDTPGSIRRVGNTTPNLAPQICFLFTGQGAQYAGMGKELYEQSVIFKSHFDWADSIVTNEHGMTSLSKALFDEPLMKQPLYAQTANFVVQYCLLKLLESWGLKPTVVLGHSMGEYAAAVAAGLLSPADGLKLVIAKAKLTDALVKPSSMIVVDKDSLTCFQYLKILDLDLEVAAVNAESQTVLAGETEKVKIFKGFCDNNGVKATILNSAYGFHSKMMDPMLDDMAKVAMEISYHGQSETTKFISSVDGGVELKTMDASYWIRNTREAVRFLDASQTVAKMGINLFLELGPHPVLSALTMTNAEEMGDVVCLPSLRRGKDGWETLLTSLGRLYVKGVNLDWKGLHRFSGGKRVDLPTYPFDESKSYWTTIREGEGKSKFHCLVGSYIPSPCETLLFHNKLGIHTVSYLKDHALGDKIIYPCAGFIEMMLVGGHAATKCRDGIYIRPSPGQPVGVEDFQIHSPVCLNDKVVTEFQTVAERNTQGELTVSAFTRIYIEDGRSKWVKNAASTWTTDCHLPDSVTSNPPDLEKLKKSCFEEVIGDSFDYKRGEEYGFNFGPTFQGMKGGHRNIENDEHLFHIETLTDSDELSQYILHPCLMDLMLQAQNLGDGILSSSPGVQKKTLVPVAIKQLVYLDVPTPKGYIYVKRYPGSYREVFLLSEDGRVVAIMLGAECIETTIHNIMAQIEAQKNPYPTMAEITWREQLGPRERRVAPINLQGVISTMREETLTKGSTLIPSKFTNDEQTFYDLTEQTVGVGLLKFFKRLGLGNVPLNQPFHYKEMAEKNGILPTFYKYFRYILQELGREGWISRGEGDSMFFIPKPLPSMDEIKTMSQILCDQLEIVRIRIGLLEHLNLMEQIMDNLPEILTGKISALKFLFSEKGVASERNAVEVFYCDSLFAKESAKLYGLMNHFISTIGKASGLKGIVRVLEVGAGTGNATVQAIKAMTECGPSHYEYTYTDISPVFLERGKQLFAGTGIAGKFGVLDIEKCPVQQGFVPGHYDLIIAVWVVHATKSIEESARNLTHLLRPGGYLLLLELTTVNRAVNVLFGGLEGFWRFTDTEVREWHCELPLDKWDSLLGKLGYDEILPPTSVFGNANSLIIGRKKEGVDTEAVSPSPSSQGGRWVVIASEDLKDDPFTGKLLYQLPGEAILIYKAAIVETEGEVLKSVWAQATEENDEISGLIYLPGNKEDPHSSCEPFMYVCQFLSGLKDQRGLKVALLTRGLVAAGTEDYRLEAPSCSPVVGMMHALQNENPELSCKCIDIDEGNEDTFSEAFHDLIVWDEEAVVSYRNRHRCVPRLRNYRVKQDTLSIPSSSRYRLVLPKTNLIDDLQFAPIESEHVGDNEVEVQVKVYGLNFRDTLVVTKPDPFFNTINTVGFDISGVITKLGAECDTEKLHLGQRVVSMRADGLAMPSHIVVPSDYVIPIPDEMTFEEGSTYPAACATVVYCLMEVAKTKKDDVVLIHTASGAVGIMAIQLCQRIIGCEVVATAGTERKRNYLKGLGVRHVFNSRNTSYKEDIRKALGGRGVTVVLNSLTGPGFKEATLSLCEQGARFVEMSKIDIWTNEEVKAMRPDIQYDPIYISLIPKDELRKLKLSLKDYFDPSTPQEKRLMPIPSTRFEAAEIRQALEYLEKVKHVGKVVVRMPEPGTQGDPAPFFNEFSTYLITGGIGGIGFEVAQWMLKNGARTLILTARRPPKPSVAMEIEHLRAKGNNVIVNLCDIGDWAETKGIFDMVERDNLPPLRGIMHVAGVIDDGSWGNQNWEKFKTVFNPKVDGTMNLHKLSLTLPFPLEHFVMFSSLSSVIGSVTQCNYVAANYYQDSLAYYRNCLGLPAATINWGQWGGVGLVANTVYAWLKPFTVPQGLAALEHTLRSHRIQVAAYEGDLASLGKSLASCRALTSELAERGSGQKGRGASIDSDAFWNDYDAAQTFEEKYDVVKTFIGNLLKQILLLSETDEIDDNANLQEMGVDSLMMVEMKNGLQGTIGKRAAISVSSVKDCKTLAQLSEKMVELISGKEEVIANLSREQLTELLLSDAELGEDLVPSLDQEIKATLTPIENVGTVLLTGSTGFFGLQLLREVCCRPAIKKIYLLIRQTSMTNLRDRFVHVLAQRGLNSWLEKYNILEKVEFVQGDLSAKAMLGLDLETYNRLSSEVEAIIDAGARVVFEQPYRESKSPNDPRTVNVLGFKQLLKFSVDGGKLKHIYHTSAALAESRMGTEGNNISETWMDEENFEYTVDSAYILSKVVCEMLSQKASSRGVPIKSFRLPYLGGDLETGNDVQLMNILMTRSYGFMTLGFMPAVNFPLNVLPVDVAAKWSLDTFFNPKADIGPYNVFNPIPGNENEFAVLAEEEFHVDIEIIALEDFTEKLKSLGDDRELNQILKIANVFDQDWQGLEEVKAPVLLSWLGGNRELYVSKKLEELLPQEVYIGGNVPSSKELLKRDLKMAQTKGLFQRFKINPK